MHVSNQGNVTVQRLSGDDARKVGWTGKSSVKTDPRVGNNGEQAYSKDKLQRGDFTVS